VTLLSKIVNSGQDRLILGGAVVIAANAGGAWTPIGDVTTTMLWIDGQISTIAVMRDLFLPSLVCMIVSISCLSLFVSGEFQKKSEVDKDQKLEPFAKIVFFLGIGVLVFVPIFKIWTGLPPFMGVLFGLCILWLVTDIAHGKFEDRQ